MVEVFKVVEGLLLAEVPRVQLNTAILHSSNENAKPKLDAVIVETAVLTTLLPPGWFMPYAPALEVKTVRVAVYPDERLGKVTVKASEDKVLCTAALNV